MTCLSESSICPSTGMAETAGEVARKRHNTVEPQYGGESTNRYLLMALFSQTRLGG